MKRSAGKITLLLLLLVIISSGCAYFNTYYNAERYYEQGIQNLERGRGGRAQTNKLNESLKVASRVLEFYPESRWVDDALLLMGKSYFYLQNYYNAIKKFSELREQFPESELIPHCNLWQAKSLLELQEYDEAKTWLVLIVESKAPRDVWVESRMVLGVILEELGNLDQAAGAYREVADDARDRQLKGKAFYQLGLVSLRMNRLQDAADSFARVRRFHPGVDIEREATLGQIDAEILLGNYARAQKLISRGLKDEHFFEEWDRFEAKECLILQEQGDLATAVECYRGHLQEYTRLASSATACFRLGSIYLLHYDQPDSALQYYNRVKTEQRESIWTDSTEVMLTKLNRLLDLLGDLSLADSLLELNRLQMDPEWLRRKAMWEMVTLYRQEELRLADSLAGAALTDSLALADSLQAALSDSLFTSDSLMVSELDSSAFFSGEDVIPEPLPQFEERESDIKNEPVPEQPGLSRIGDDDQSPAGEEQPPVERGPLFDDSRDLLFAAEEDSSVVADSTAELSDSLLALQQAREDTLLFLAFMDSASFTAQIDSTALIASRDSLRLAWGDKVMTLGELYLLEMDRRDDADSLMQAVDTTWLAERQLVHRRWFIGWIRELEGDSTTARKHYDFLLAQYPLSEEAKYLRHRLGLPAQMSAEDYAAAMCRQAERLWEDSLRYLDALELYREVVNLFPETTVAPRAQLAEAWLFSRYLENQTMTDQVLDKLFSSYPASPEAMLAERWRSGDTGEDETEEQKPEVESQVMENLLEPQQNESGMFLRRDEAARLDIKIENFQVHMLDIGVLRVHRILK